MDKYWIKISNIEKGPLTFEDLLDYYLESSTPFWCYGLKEWINFCDSEIFAKYNREIQNRERNKLKKIKQLKKKT